MGNPVTISKLDPTDVIIFEELILLFESVFETVHPSRANQAYLRHLLGDKNVLVMAALLNKKVAGGITAYILPQYYSASSLLYIYDLAVDPRLQRQGIGKQLVSAIIDEGRRIGISEIFVQANQEDKEAIEFYKATGATSEEVVHFTFKPL